jgi:hypothetical protein
MTFHFRTQAMAKIRLEMAMQDEKYFFHFLLSSPRHRVVLHMIAGAIKKYHGMLSAAARAHDIGLQQDIALVVKFLKCEARDRVEIRNEHYLIYGFERLFGEAAVEDLLQCQRSKIAALEAESKARTLKAPKLSQVLEGAGVYALPNWGMMNGRANINQLAKIRSMRHEICALTRNCLKAYHDGRRNESWSLKMQYESVQADLHEAATIQGSSRPRELIVQKYGLDECLRVVAWVHDNTRMPEYEAMRDTIKAIRAPHQVYMRSSSVSDLRISR